MALKTSISKLKQTFLLNKKVSKLLNSVNEVGVTDQFFHYIKLTNGKYFFGPPTLEQKRKMYFLLPKSAKLKLPFSHYSIATDIIIRYQEGGLKYGGPAKESFYKVKTNDIVAEMGSYRGFYTIYLADKVGEQGFVVAIEPIEDNLTYLKKNIEANHLNNVLIVPKAIWSSIETKVFNQRQGDDQSASIGLEYDQQNNCIVQADTLDNILAEAKVKNVDFMLIQLNGAEYEALKGLNTLSPDNLAIAARYRPNGEDVAALIISLLEQRSYTITTIDHNFIYAKKL